VFRNTELIYNNDIGEMVHRLGFKGMLTEGARHIMGWRSPNFLYYNPKQPDLHLLLKNFRLSDDIAFRFSERGWSEWPLTTEKYVEWVNELPWNEEVINLFMDYETFGEHQWEDSGIFEFMRKLPEQVMVHTEYEFHTPSEVLENLQPVAGLDVPHAISWADEERDLTAWLGNDLQDDAFDTLYNCQQQVKACKDPKLLQDWTYLQTSDHFYYMCTKFFNDGDVHKYFNHYESPYEAYINYMNVLADFKKRLKASAEA
jgi:alpha-amylase